MRVNRFAHLILFEYHEFGIDLLCTRGLFVCCFLSFEFCCSWKVRTDQILRRKSKSNSAKKRNHGKMANGIQTSTSNRIHGSVNVQRTASSSRSRMQTTSSKQLNNFVAQIWFWCQCIGCISVCRMWHFQLHSWQQQKKHQKPVRHCLMHFIF